MNPEIKQAWLAALRSGDYPQVRGYMRTEEGFCCLGVLADIMEPTCWGVKLTCDGSYSMRYNPVFNELEEVLIRPLIDKNDNKGLNFNQIADWIEENVQ